MANEAKLGLNYPKANTKDRRGRNQGEKANLPTAGKRVEIENLMLGLGANIKRNQEQLGTCTVARQNAQSALKGHAKSSDEHTAITAEIGRLDLEISQCKDRLSVLNGKYAKAEADMKTALKSYGVDLSAEIGNYGYESMIEPIRAAILDAKDLHVQLSSEASAAEIKYQDFDFKIPCVFEKLDAALKVVDAVQKALGKA